VERTTAADTGAAGIGTAGDVPAAGTAAGAAPWTGARPVACERASGATAACAEGLPIIRLSLGSTAGSAVAPGSETPRPICASSQLRSAAVSGREARGGYATTPELRRNRRSGPATGFLTVDLQR
jgi:hypothetical protein